MPELPDETQITHQDVAAYLIARRLGSIAAALYCVATAIFVFAAVHLVIWITR